MLKNEYLDYLEEKGLEIIETLKNYKPEDEVEIYYDGEYITIPLTQIFSYDTGSSFIKIYKDEESMQTEPPIGIISIDKISHIRKLEE